MRDDTRPETTLFYQAEPVRTGSAATQFRPGTSGNPVGRPRGSRNRLSETFVAELCQDFEIHGRSVIEAVRRLDPIAYLAIIAKLVPKDFASAAEQPKRQVSDLTDEELVAIIEQT